MLSTDKIVRAGLRSAVLWGAVATAAFYLGLPYVEEWLPQKFVEFTTGRLEIYACVALFLIGLAAAIIKLVDLGQNWYACERINLGPVPTGEASVATVRGLLKTIESQPKFCQGTVLQRRLREAFEFLTRKGGQESIEGHLRYLADMDTAQMNTSYGLPRFLCWAIPAVGSLGAVLGIALAIGELSAVPEALSPAPAADTLAAAPAEAAPEQQQAFEPGALLAPVTAGLTLAFETMALAIGLSLVLMFLKFACEHAECHLLDAVERRVQQEVNQRAAALTVSRGSQPEQMHYLAERLKELTDKLAGLSSAPVAAGAAHGGMTPDQIESIVSRAMSQASVGQPHVSFGGGGQLTDMSQVQDALKQIAAFFSIQQAEHQQESEIVRQLSDIIEEASSSNGKPRKSEGLAGSLAGLWNSLSD